MTKNDALMHHQELVRREVGMAEKEPTRRISIRSVKKNPPDLGKLGRALIALAMMKAEAEARAQATESDKPEDTPAPDSEDGS
jgi:hypothetical protein